ncbi:MAG: HNH endonuclease family protein [Solirubrobacteraceae bacterium]|nr:HNH endonuclease family protein [Solirubrobacteraceae bacterium]
MTRRSSSADRTGWRRSGRGPARTLAVAGLVALLVGGCAVDETATSEPDTATRPGATSASDGRTDPGATASDRGAPGRDVVPSGPVAAELTEPVAGRTAPGVAPGDRPTRVTPQDDPRGLHRGLGTVRGTQRARGRRLIVRIPAGPGLAPTPYRRDAFGSGWNESVPVAFAGNGCRTRDDVLTRDLLRVRRDADGCRVESGLLEDPYTGRAITFDRSRPTAVQIDHVVPLSYAHRHGAHAWGDRRRRQFANDPLNLLAVDGPTNQRKSDDGPARAPLPNPALRCSYAVRFAMVLDVYALTVAPEDRTAMRDACE